MSLPNWPRWLAKGSATLEECVALSLDRAPSWTQTISTTEAPSPSAVGDPARRKKRKGATPAGPILRTTVMTSHPSLTEPAGRERLQVLRECFADGSPLLLRADDDGQPAARVRLSDFARWAVTLGWALPVPLAALATRLPEEQRQERHTAAPAAPGQAADPARSPVVVPQLRKEKAQTAQWARILSALVHEYGDVQRLPFYMDGAVDPAKEVARLALPDLGEPTVSRRFQELHRLGEVGPRVRKLKKGDPRLPRP